MDMILVSCLHIGITFMPRSPRPLISWSHHPYPIALLLSLSWPKVEVGLLLSFLYQWLEHQQIKEVSGLKSVDYDEEQEEDDDVDFVCEQIKVFPCCWETFVSKPAMAGIREQEQREAEGERCDWFGVDVWFPMKCMSFPFLYLFPSFQMHRCSSFSEKLVPLSFMWLSFEPNRA